MKKSSLIILFIIVGFVAYSQSYFVIEELHLNPEDPTSKDTIMITLSGFLVDSGSRIDTSFAYNEENEVFINLECSSTGGYQVTSDHDEEIVLGVLSAGSYHINITGNYFMNNIDVPSVYDFEVRHFANVEELANNNSIIYPNPTSGTIFLKNNGFDVDKIQLINLQGQLIESFEYSEKFDISDYPIGVYMIFIYYQNSIIAQKIIKY